MAIEIESQYKQDFAVSKSLRETYGLLADVRVSIPAYFEGLESFVEKEPAIYLWKFESLKQAGQEIALSFRTHFRFREPNYIGMESVPGSESGDLSGGWTLSEEGALTHILFETRLRLRLPIPFFLKTLAAPFAEKELTKFFDRYVENLRRALS